MGRLPSIFGPLCARRKDMLPLPANTSKGQIMEQTRMNTGLQAIASYQRRRPARRRKTPGSF